jgi:hypothetical protein
MANGIADGSGKSASSLSPTAKMAEKTFRRRWDDLADSVHDRLSL